MKIIKKSILLCTVFFFISGIISPKGALGITIQEEEELSREFMKVILTHF
jgi:hypothetical protein